MRLRFLSHWLPLESHRVLMSTLLGAGLLLSLTCPVHAAETWTAVRLRIAGREVSAPTPALTNGKEVYIPFEALALAGVTGRLNRNGDALLVSQATTGRKGELALARPKGKPMLALADLAQWLDAEVIGPQPPDAETPPPPSGTGKEAPKPSVPQPKIQNPKSKIQNPERLTSNNIVYLLARLKEVRWEDGTLRVQTSFPVPYRIKMLTIEKPLRGYVDCLGAVVPEPFRAEPLPTGERRALQLRVGQNTPEVARVVVTLAAGQSWKERDVTANYQARILAPLETSKTASKPTEIASNPPPQPPQPIEPRGGSRTEPRPRTTTPPARGGTPSRGGSGKREQPPVEVTGISLQTDNDGRFMVEIATTSRCKPFVHYGLDTPQLVIDIPNAFLRLATEARSEQRLSHPLVKGLRVEMVQETPPQTRITLETPRVVGFTVNALENKLTLELRLPRNATGVLADKRIVVDAGHGGSAAGAVSGGVQEKDLTLAVALKLRSYLEAQGARVVMTRDQDIDVGLYDRPALANSINADLFISIHADSTNTPNSASGTSTYYHKGEPSSRALAYCVQQAVSSVTGLPSRGALSDGILYENGLAVLRGSQMPAILVEMAYINNTLDRRKLTDTDFQERVAKAISEGIKVYIEGNPLPSPSDMPTETEDKPAPSDEEPPTP